MRIKILSVPRSGSTYLYHVLTQAFPDHICCMEQRPENNLNNGYIDKIEQITAKSLSKLYDIKSFRLDNVDWQSENIIAKLHIHQPQHGDNWHTIKLMRKDEFKQILSFAIAIQTLNFIDYRQKEMAVSHSAFKFAYSLVSKQISKIKTAKCDKQIYYEDLSFDPYTDLKLLGFNTNVETITTIKKNPDHKKIVKNYSELEELYKHLLGKS